MTYFCAFMCGVSLGSESYVWALFWFVMSVATSPWVTWPDNPER